MERSRKRKIEEEEEEEAEQANQMAQEEPDVQLCEESPDKSASQPKVNNNNNNNNNNNRCLNRMTPSVTGLVSTGALYNVKHVQN